MGRIRVSSEKEDREEAVKKKLRSYRTLLSKYIACYDYFTQLYPATTTHFNPNRVMESKANKNEDKMVTMIDLEQIMTASLEAMLVEIKSIKDMIETLPADECTIILRRYTLNESMEQISVVIFLSARQCWRLHASALRRLSKACQ